MKKLIISEVVSVILVIGVFLLVFTLLNGWEKAGQERYDAAALAVVAVVAAAVVVVAAIAAVDATVGAAVVAAVGAVVAAALVVAVGGAVVGGAIAVVAAVVAAAAIAVVAAVVTVVVRDKEIMEKINNASKKVIWSSLGAEAVAIILPIILITFC